jgi:sigma-B regulation protein RsbU (phosphoserine phosphatase)
MKKPTLLYIPLLFLFVLTATVLVIHFSKVFAGYNVASKTIELPYTTDGEIISVKPEAETAGLKRGDVITAVNGTTINNTSDYERAISKLNPGEPVNLNIARRNADGEHANFEITLTTKPQERGFNYYSRLAVGFVYIYLLPIFCILLGFWVVLVRPHDFLAWLLLFVLLGVSTISFEGNQANYIVRFYQRFFFSTWSLSMLLFGIYFPERLDLDKRLPWLKMVIIIPLCLQILLDLLGQLKPLGLNIIDSLGFIVAPVNVILMPLHLTAIGMFFAALGYKSGTIKNPDSRRRLRLIVIGTSVAMVPSLIIILYRLISGARGGFFDIVPFWFALFALFAMLLFPLTLAYVIVVHRAMDVSVVIRQGLQYALAKNGVRVLQFFLLFAVGLGTLFTINNYGQGISRQIAFIVVGIALVPLIDFAARRLKVWVDRRFFREAYNAELILSDLSEEVRTMVETRPILETVSNKISESLHVPQVVFLLRNGMNFHPAYALGFADSLPVAFDEKNVTVGKLRKNEAITVYADDKASWINTENLDGEREKLEKLNSQLLLPVGVKEKLLGFLSLSPKKSEEPYTANDLRLLKSVAAQTGLALENSRLTEEIVSETALRERLNREVEIAREVQERLFPQDLPKVKNLDYFGGCRPALGVGGDYYDFFELENGKFGIAIGDVSGKGIGASLMMASLQASLRGQAIHFDEDLATLMCNVNRLVYETSTSNRYATFFYAQFDSATRKLSYVNAGHNAPFLFRKRGETYELLRLEMGGAVVGMLPPMLISYEQGEIELQQGDLLIGFTDGISEAMNPDDDEWGEERMIEAIKEKIDLPAKEMFDYLVVCADNFANGAKQHDDMTAIIVRLV